MTGFRLSARAIECTLASSSLILSRSPSTRTSSTPVGRRLKPKDGPFRCPTSLGFDPCERPEHYPGRGDPKRFDAQVEQRRASQNASLPIVVTDELALMDRADLLVLQYPMWWHLPPAMMKGWFDRVLAYGAA